MRSAPSSRRGIAVALIGIATMGVTACSTSAGTAAMPKALSSTAGARTTGSTPTEHASSSSASTGPLALATVISAARKTLRTTASVRTTFRAAVVDSGVTTQSQALVTGVADLAHRTGKFHIALTAGSRKAAGFDEVLATDRVYAHGFGDVPAATWIAAPRSSVRFTNLYRTAANDPSEVLRRLLDAEFMTELGPSRADGAAVTHFRGALTRASLTDLGTVQVAKNLDVISRQVGRDAFACDVWINSAGHVARVEIGFDRAAQGFVYTARTDFTAYSKPFAIARPSQVELVKSDLSGPVLG